MTDAPSSPGQRPVHLWVVGILALIWNAGGAFDYLMTQSRNEAYMAAFTAEQLEYFYGYPEWATAAWALAVWGGVLGSLLLLLRKGLAESVFLVSFLAMVINTLYTSTSGGWTIMGSGGTVAFSAAIFVFALALWLYARGMRLQGILR